MNDHILALLSDLVDTLKSIDGSLKKIASNSDSISELSDIAWKLSNIDDTIRSK